MITLLYGKMEIDRQIADTTRDILNIVKPPSPTRDQLDFWVSLLSTSQSKLDPGPKEIQKNYAELEKYSADVVWRAITEIMKEPPYLCEDLSYVVNRVKQIAAPKLYVKAGTTIDDPCWKDL